MIFLRFLIFTALLLLSFSARAADGNFRHMIWGATPNDVKAFETARFYKEEAGSLYFVDQVTKEDLRQIRYDFIGNKLWRGMYSFQQLTDPDPNNILNKYEDFKLDLEKQYGKADDEVFTWKDKTYRNYPQYWGRALLSKNLKVRSEWEQPGTKVVLNVYYEEPYYNLSYTAEQAGIADKAVKDNLLNIPIVRPDVPKQP